MVQFFLRKISLAIGVSGHQKKIRRTAQIFLCNMFENMMLPVNWSKIKGGLIFWGGVEVFGRWGGAGGAIYFPLRGDGIFGCWILR